MRRTQLEDDLAKLKMQRRFDQTVADLIDEICADTEQMAMRIGAMGELISRQWPGAFHTAHGLKEKSALLKRAYQANVKK